MPAFTLYGAHGSSNTDRVRLVLAEASFTDYEYVPLNLSTGEAKSAENLARNPFGKIPVAVFQDGFTLYESRAICKYLARKHAPHLLPSGQDAEEEARFEQALAVESSYFNTPAAVISFESFAKPRFLGLPTDESAVAVAVKQLEVFFDIADGLLERNSYMAGDEFSLADVFYIPLVQRLFDCGYSGLVDERKAVAAWWQRCVERPGVRGMLSKH